MLTLTQSAVEQIQDVLIENGSKYIRAFVQGGGCAGFSYGFAFENIKNDDDFEVDGILIDVISMQYLEGAILDYKQDLLGSSFTFTNPNATTTCGCGSSFAVM